MNQPDAGASRPSRDLSWKQKVLQYQEPSLPRALWQLVNTLGLYGLLWWLAVWSLDVSYWLTAALAILAGGVLVRVFIIFHDCGHGSFFRNQVANDVVGFITGMLTFTPYYHWRWEHAIHHATGRRIRSTPMTPDKVMAP